MTLKIEVGKYYRNANDVKVGPIEHSSVDGCFRGPGITTVVGKMRRGDDPQIYNADGSVYAVREGEEQDHLIAEWVDAPEKTVGTLEELNAQVGDQVQFRNPGAMPGSIRTISTACDGVYQATYDDGREASCVADKPYWHLISRAADTKRKETVAIPPVIIPDETPLDHFGQPANDNDGVPQTSKDAYAEIARSLGHAVMAHVEAGDYEQALRCAALMRRAEMVPVETADLTRFLGGHTGGFFGGRKA